MKTPEERARAACEARAARAAAIGPSDVLRFAEGLFRVQAALVGRGEDARPLLEYVASKGPAALAADAREMMERPAAFAQRVCDTRAGGEFDYLARAALTPLALLERERGGAFDKAPGPCPFCGGIPWMASRKPGGQAEGSLRMLHCSVCWNAWNVSRLRCPACGQEDPHKLPFFSAPEHPHVRIEACEQCKGYVKSIDLSEDARPIPEVDDLRSLSLDLWAAEQGFERLEPGLAGALD
ncbi:MAG TPA: formate dehydrogenase accessory protein FdhE [Myxococcales bacterium]|nr:formate dehydrogenase accessory protein FdhE [Myxococcales bacterium]